MWNLMLKLETQVFLNSMLFLCLGRIHQQMWSIAKWILGRIHQQMCVSAKHFSNSFTSRISTGVPLSQLASPQVWNIYSVSWLVLYTLILALSNLCYHRTDTVCLLLLFSPSNPSLSSCISLSWHSRSCIIFLLVTSRTLPQTTSPLSCCAFFCSSCSVVKSCPTLCNPMEGSTPGFPLLHYLPEFT